MPEADTLDFVPEAADSLDFQPETLDFQPDPLPPHHELAAATESVVNAKPLFDDPPLTGMDQAVAKGLNYARNVGIEALTEISPEMAGRVFGKTTASLREEEKAPPLLSPEVARQIVGQLPTAFGGETAFGEGVAASTTDALVGLSKPSMLAQLPTFAVPGVAETFALNVLWDDRKQIPALYNAIQEHGVNSAEAGQAAGNLGISNLMGFLAGKSSVGGKTVQFKVEQMLKDAQLPVRLASASEAVPATSDAPSTVGAALVEPVATAEEAGGKPATESIEPDIVTSDGVRSSASSDPAASTETITPPAPPVQPEGWRLPEEIPIGTEASIAELNRQLGPNETRANSADSARVSPDTAQAATQEAPVAPEILQPSREAVELGNDWTEATAEPVPVEAGGMKLRKRAGESGYTDLIPDVLDFGKRVFEKGMDFAKWSAEMVRHLGEKVKEHLSGIWDTLQRVTGDERGSIGGNIGLNIAGKRTHLDAATTARSAKLQKSFADAERAQKEIGKVANERRQAAMSVWMEAGGDSVKLAGWATAAKGKMFKRAAQDALTLSPKEIAMAQKVEQTFQVLERRGQTYDVLSNHRDNYVPHVWDVTKKASGIGSSKLQDRFKFNKARAFENFFEGDQAGFKPKTLAIGKLLPSYLHEMNTVIADRQFVQEVSHGVGSDQRPLLLPRGNAKTVDTTEYAIFEPGGKRAKSVHDTMKEAQAALKPGQTIQTRPSSSAQVNPKGFAKAENAAGNPIEQGDYRVQSDQPALSNWRWVETDPKGNTTILKSDLATHPELTKRLNSMMGKSALRQWYNEPSTGLAVIPKAIIKNLDVAQSVMKREMFGLLAPFHQVQEGTHAIGHAVNPFFGLEDMSRPTPQHVEAMQHGLMLLPEKGGGTSYIEGVGGKNSFPSQMARKFGGPVGRAISNVIDGYQNYLFHQYIPALKYKTYEHIVTRNMKRFQKELAAGKVTVGDVKMLSAEQSNAAYGHLNYALLDRNPTIQHVIQLVALAPDFLEARGRFVSQALKPGKAGFEQFRAIALLAAAQAGTAIVISNILGAEYDPRHPFAVTYKNRRYEMRSVPADLYRFLFEGSDVRREFVTARANPVASKIVQMGTGRNYRGEKTGFWDTVGELLTNYIPITARGIPGIRTLTETSRNSPISPLEQLAGAIGLKVSRYSPVTKVYQMAHEWEQAQGIAADTGSYPVSKYQQLRYALEGGDFDRAKTEYQNLRTAGMKSDKITKGFKESINHPFTGTKANDEAFRKSLSVDDRKMYDFAVQRRKDILARYNRMMYPTSSN